MNSKDFDQAARDGSQEGLRSSHRIHWCRLVGYPHEKMTTMGWRAGVPNSAGPFVDTGTSPAASNRVFPRTVILNSSLNHWRTP